MKTRKSGLFVLFISMLFSPIYATDWWTTIVDTTRESGVHGTSIALDSLGIPHLAYCRYNAGGLVYASFNPADSSWSYELVFDSVKVGGKIAGTDPSLALDSKGYPHISFWWGDLGYAWKDSLGWHTTHPYTEHWIYGTSLKLDKNDYPHIGHTGVIHWNPYISVVLYTYWDGRNWHTEVIDTIFGGYPGCVSLTLDSNDWPHLAYESMCEKGIRYAHCTQGYGMLK